MVRKRLSFILFLFFVLSFYLLATLEAPPTLSQEVELEGKKAEYELPYPGILPDHPLYFLKMGRDRLLLFFTRDQLKKAELYLLYSDKRAHMAIELSKKGKWQLAETTISKGEKYFLKIPPAISKSREQGVSPPEDFILKIKLSHEKHSEIIESLLKDAPQGERRGLEGVLNLNKHIGEMVSTL